MNSLPSQRPERGEQATSHDKMLFDPRIALQGLVITQQLQSGTVYIFPSALQRPSPAPHCNGHVSSCDDNFGVHGRSRRLCAEKVNSTRNQFTRLIPSIPSGGLNSGGEHSFRDFSNKPAREIVKGHLGFERLARGVNPAGARIQAPWNRRSCAPGDTHIKRSPAPPSSECGLLSAGRGCGSFRE